MRVIQDSDDELSEEDLESELAPSRNSEHPTKPLIDANSAVPQPGTGSTGSLERAFETTHRAHLQAHSNSPMPTLPVDASTFGPSVSFRGGGSEAQQTPASATVAQFHEANSIKTNPQSIDGKESKPRSSSPLPEHHKDGTSFHNGIGISSVTEQKPSNPPGSVRAHVHPEADVLFTEPSSTVPNATLTQQRLLEGVMPPPFLGIDDELDLPPFEPAKSSIPWSDYLQPTQGNTQPPEPVTNHEPSSDQAKQNLPNISSDPTPEIENQNDVITPAEMTRLSHQCKVDGLPGLVNASSSNIQQKDLEPNPATGLLPIEPNPSSTPSDDDLGTIELSKDQYKPRPSRSRSLKVDAHDQSNNSRTDRATRRKTRRNKTVDGMDALVTPRKLQRICDMGFTPSTTGRALKQNDGDVSRTVDWLIANGVADDELAPLKSSKEKVKDQSRKRKTGTTDPEITPTKVTLLSPVSNEEPNLHSCNEPTETAPTEITPKDISSKAEIINDSINVSPAQCQSVKVIIPRSKKPTVQGEGAEDSLDVKPDKQPNLPKTPGRRVKRRRTTLDTPEIQLGEGEAESKQVVQKNDTRRRISKDAPEPAEATQERENMQCNNHQAAPNAIESTIVQTAETKEIEGGGRLEDIHTTATIFPASTPTSNNKTAPELARTPEKKEKPTSSSHSPLSKGKVPYRVGLSKRTRIAPLLRTLRK